MAGRPITNHTRRAQQKRESMRRARERDKQERRSIGFDAHPLAQIIQQWRTQ